MSRFIVVTGAASGIGKAIADTLRDQGDEVLGFDREDGPDIAALDLARADAGDAALDLLDGRDPDGLVNAAAVFHSGSMENTKGADWDRLYAVNLRGPYLLTRAFADGLVRRKGAVVNISSVNAVRNARHNFAYDSLKAAMDHMTRGLALEFRGQGVRVNAVAPGGTATNGMAQWLTQATHLSNRPDAAGIARNVETGVFAAPSDIAGVARFLLSDEARWINGAVILADNGGSIGQPE